MSLPDGRPFNAKQGFDQCHIFVIGMTYITYSILYLAPKM